MLEKSEMGSEEPIRQKERQDKESMTDKMEHWRVMVLAKTGLALKLCSDYLEAHIEDLPENRKLAHDLIGKLQNYTAEIQNKKSLEMTDQYIHGQISLEEYEAYLDNLREICIPELKV